MKIERLSISQFRCHDSLDVPLDRVTVIVGANGTGKSSIKAALEYALTGRCEWTDGRGSGADELIKHGIRQANITVGIEGLGQIQRTVPNYLRVEGMDGPTTDQQKALYERLGASEQVLSALFNTGAFLSLDRAAQKTLLFGLLGFTFTREDLAAKISEFSGREDAAGWIIGQLVEDVYGPDVFDRLEKAAVEERRTLKRVAKELDAQAVPSVPLPEGVTAEQAEQVDKLLQELSAERDGLMRQLGEGRASTQARESLISRRNAAKTKVELGEKTVRSMPVPDEEALEQAKATFKEARDEDRALNDQHAELLVRCATFEGQIAGVSGTIETLSRFDGSCPLAPQAVQCPMSREDVGAVLKQLGESVGALRTQMAEIEAELRQIEEARSAARAAKADAEKQIAELEKRGVAFENARVDLDRARTALREAEQELASAPEATGNQSETEQAIAMLDARIAKGRGIQQAIVEHKRTEAARQAYTARQAKTTTDLLLIEALCTALGPKGLRARMLGDAVKKLQERANERFQALTAGEYSVEFLAGDDLQILVTRKGHGTRPAANLSASEKFRVGIVMQDVLAGLSGLGFLVIDGADILDTDNRALMMQMIMQMAPDYDTILVLSTLGDVEPVDPGVKGLSIYVLDDGKLVRAKRAQAA